MVPALVWSASCSFRPLVGMLGADWRIGGRGGLDWRLWGWLPAVTQSGPGPLDAAMLARWLAGAGGRPANVDIMRLKGRGVVQWAGRG